jgi:hypothetical protein
MHHMHSTCRILCTATEVQITPESVVCILIGRLGKWKICDKCIPYVLYDDQCAMNFIFPTLANRDILFDQILMVDETWKHLCDPELKQYSADWWSPIS